MAEKGPSTGESTKTNLLVLNEASLKLILKGAYFKDDRNFWAIFDPLPPSERKMTSLLLYTMTSLLLILTAFCRPPPSPTLRSSLKYPPLN